MTTMRDLIADTRRMTYGSLPDQINPLASAYTAGDTELVFELDVTGITPGMLLSSGLNVWFVKGSDAANNTVFVIPGYDNATGGNAAVGDFVYIKPRTTDWYLFNMLNEEIKRLSSPSNGLYKIDSWEADVDATWQTYEIPSEVLPELVGLLRVRYRMPGTEDVWLDIPEKSYRMQINDSTSYIRLLRNVPSGTEIQFLYKAPFTAATSLTSDIVSFCGLTDSMTDIPPLGAYSTLLRTTESRRNQISTQGDSRRAQEVGAGANATTMQLVDRDYQARIREEYARLVQRVPIVRSL
jgi:hypothetical protein